LVVSLVGCAHSQQIKTVSKEQEALLIHFKTALEDIQVRLRTAFDESVEDYKKARLRVFLNSESRLLSTRIEGCIRKPKPVCEMKDGRTMLNEASQYLAEAEVTIFTEGFCGPNGTWTRAKMAWMKRTDEVCLKQPYEIVNQLEGARDTLDANFKKLREQIIAVQNGHTIIDKFLQVKIEIKPEDVETAKGTIEKATKAVSDAKAALDTLAKGK
jgi:hypothetical protein